MAWFNGLADLEDGATTDSTAGRLSQMAITGNVCQVQSGNGLVLNIGVGAQISGNQFYNSGTGITVGANVTSAVVADNQFNSVTPIVNTNPAVLARLESNGHTTYIGAAPAISACGGKGSGVTGTDQVATVTTGTTATTSCVVISRPTTTSRQQILSTR